MLTGVKLAGSRAQGAGLLLDDPQAGINCGRLRRG
jgi:hypothetical protein